MKVNTDDQLQGYYINVPHNHNRNYSAFSGNFVSIHQLVLCPGEAPTLNVNNKSGGFYALFAICIRQNGNKFLFKTSTPGNIKKFINLVDTV